MKTDTLWFTAFCAAVGLWLATLFGFVPSARGAGIGVEWLEEPTVEQAKLAVAMAAEAGYCAGLEDAHLIGRQAFAEYLDVPNMHEAAAASAAALHLVVEVDALRQRFGCPPIVRPGTHQEGAK